MDRVILNTAAKVNTVCRQILRVRRSVIKLALSAIILASVRAGLAFSGEADPPVRLTYQELGMSSFCSVSDLAGELLAQPSQCKSGKE